MRCNLSNDIRSQYFGTFLKVNPDKLRHGVQEFESDNEKEILYMFLTKYVRKTHADSEIK